MNTMPGVVIKANDDAAFAESLFVVIAECEERKASSVPGVVSVDADYT
jgi:hypothetical protein